MAQSLQLLSFCVQKMQLLLLLLLLCSGASALKRSIHRIIDKKTWKDAQTYCRKHHTDLLTIRDQAENQELRDSGWIGLDRAKYSIVCRWSSGHVNKSFCTWAIGEPDPNQFCGYKLAGVTGWHSKHCSNLHPFYCEDEPLILVKERKPWEEALEHCRNLPEHSTVYERLTYELASPLDLDDIDAQHVFTGGFRMMWIGLRFLGGHWMWLDGEIFDGFGVNCPLLRRCGTLEINGTTEIIGRRCHFGLFFLCARI